MPYIGINYKQQEYKKENVKQAYDYVKNYKLPHLLPFFFLQNAENFFDKMHKCLFLMPTANVLVYLSAIVIDPVVVSLFDILC
jgi:hypothetical protein